MASNWNSNGSTWNTGSTTEWNDGGAATNGDDGNNGNNTAAIESDAFGAGNTGDTGDMGGTDGACRNCGQEGHFARECDQPKKQGPCFNCGEDGHSKVDCPKPRIFKGTCNICSEEGHPAARCPSKPKICARCKVQGDHDTKDCNNNYYLDLNNVADVPEVVAWSKLSEASRDNDVDDFKDALRMLQKAAPELTYPAIEKKMRAQKMKFYLIALKKDVGGGYTLVNLQGEPDKTYCVTIMKSPECQRPNMVDKWPASPTENLERLADAGTPLEKGVSYCRVCEKFGHASRDCDQERVPVEAPKVTCALCGTDGHRVRDCTEERKKPREPRTCKICGSEDHIAKECDQKPDRPPMVCRNCDQEGHKASECEAPRKIKCSNCEEEGHMRKECPKPMDWSKVTCRHCGEKGHLSASRCAPGAAKEHNEEMNGNENNQESNGVADDGWNDDNAANSASGGNWDTDATTQPSVAAGKW